MSKKINIITLILSLICIIITTITLTYSITLNNKNNTKIKDLETKLYELESDIIDLKMLNDVSDDSTGTYDTSTFIKIKPTSINALSKNNTIILWIGRPSCSHCAKYAPVISNIGKENNLPIYYMDINMFMGYSDNVITIKNQEWYDLMTNLNTDEDNLNIMDKFGTTPMTLIIKDNTIVGNNMGYIDELALKEFLTIEGLI